MLVNTVKYSSLEKYDSGNHLWSPELFQKDRIDLWDLLQDKSSNSLDHYFLNVRDTINSTEDEVICYDLADSLSGFLDGGTQTKKFGSTKKIAKEGDFVISRLGSYLQEMGLVESRPMQQVFSTEYLVFRPKTKELSAHTLFALCMTSIVQSILNKSQYGTTHPRFYEFVLDSLPIPDNLISIDHVIKGIIDSALEKRRTSRERYQNAQKILLAELGLAHWQPPKHKLNFVKQFSDTLQGKRLDPEYYQPRFDEIVDVISAYNGGWSNLGNLVDIKKGIEVGRDEYQDEGVPFIRVSNITPYELTEEKFITEEKYAELTIYEQQELLADNKNHQPQQGEILLSKDATPGIANYIKENPPKMIIASGILRLTNKSNKVNNEYLTIVLNSLLTQEQIKRDAGGTIISHWRPEQVMETMIPILSQAKQNEIQQRVEESFELRKQSVQLLECAKRVVELNLMEN